MTIMDHHGPWPNGPSALDFGGAGTAMRCHAAGRAAAPHERHQATLPRPVPERHAPALGVTGQFVHQLAVPGPGSSLVPR